jgi:hypothetical protein
MANRISFREGIARDIKIISSHLKKLPKKCDGKKSILELKKADYYWWQMEWRAFYFEYKAKEILQSKFTFPRDKFKYIHFDFKGSINWDLKAFAIKSDSHKVILNDVKAMKKSVVKHGYHGEVIALCDVEYNDLNRTFQKWHMNLIVKKSKYVKERELRTSVSRCRKTKAKLMEILIVVFSKSDLEKLYIMKQGRNSNGNPRNPKFMLNLEDVNLFHHKLIKV